MHFLKAPQMRNAGVLASDSVAGSEAYAHKPSGLSVCVSRDTQFELAGVTAAYNVAV